MFILVGLSSSSYAGSRMRHFMIARISGDIFLTIDLILNFFRGYYDVEKSHSVLKTSEVIKHYVKTYFFIDLLPLLPSYLFIASLASQYITYVIFLRVFTFLRLFRLGRLSHILDLFRMHMNYSSYIFKAIKSILIYNILMFSFYAAMKTILSCISTFVLKEELDEEGKMDMFYSIILTLLIVSHGNEIPEDTGTLATTIIFLCIGYIMQMFLYAQVLQAWNKFASARDKNEDLLRHFKEYMKYKGLPANLRRRIFMYFNFKFQNEFFNESQINRMVSDILKQDILVHVTRKHIEQSKLFKGLPENVLLSVISQLRSVIYLPDDVIVTAGSPATTMFFIYYGTVAVFTPMGKEICHLEDGDNFGEMALVFEEETAATVVAVTACELYKLKKTDFNAILNQYPDLKAKLVADSRERLLKSES
ncbi:hypothetical protein JTB14_024792 [Gonioctena quinquepunctata]|nr:hypothetical protein JTB14_024792 [Gonioctena quinquepunctata]